jgi:Protein of unknown function (DUF3755)
VGGVDGPIAALLATNYSILDTFKQNMQTWRVSRLFRANQPVSCCHKALPLRLQLRWTRLLFCLLWQVNENTELLMQFRDNILSILNHMNSMGGVMVRPWQPACGQL